VGAIERGNSSCDGLARDVLHLLLIAGDSPTRLRSDATLCGASPIEASSAKTTHQRLNRGGDRQRNSAVWLVAPQPHDPRDPPPATTSSAAPPMAKATKQIRRELMSYLRLTPTECSFRRPRTRAFADNLVDLRCVSWSADLRAWDWP
jgi:hypothetical protein